jgi:hypothetical protein
VTKMEIATNVLKVCILKQTRQKGVDRALSNFQIVSSAQQINVLNVMSVSLS